MENEVKQAIRFFYVIVAVIILLVWYNSSYHGGVSQDQASGYSSE